MHVDVYVRHLQAGNTKTMAITKTAAAQSSSTSKVPASDLGARSWTQAVETADKLRLGKTTDTQPKRTVH